VLQTPLLVPHFGEIRACLAGLHEQLRPEPYQTVDFAPAPGVELPLDPSRLQKGRRSHVFVAPFGSASPAHRCPRVGPANATAPAAVGRGGARRVLAEVAAVGQGRAGGAGDGEAPNGERAGELAGSAAQIHLGQGALGRRGGGRRRAPKRG
jgi:hypothetical protein